MYFIEIIIKYTLYLKLFFRNVKLKKLSPLFRLYFNIFWTSIFVTKVSQSSYVVSATKAINTRKVSRGTRSTSVRGAPTLSVNTATSRARGPTTSRNTWLPGISMTTLNSSINQIHRCDKFSYRFSMEFSYDKFSMDSINFRVVNFATRSAFSCKVSLYLVVVFYSCKKMYFS